MDTRNYTIKSGKHYRKEAGEMRCYAPGDSIKLTEKEAEALMDKLVLNVTPAPLVDPDEEGGEEKEKGELTIRQVGKDKFNVINSATKRAVNEKPLSKEEAEALVKGDDSEDEE